MMLIMLILLLVANFNIAELLRNPFGSLIIFNTFDASVIFCYTKNKNLCNWFNHFVNGLFSICDCYMENIHVSINVKTWNVSTDLKIKHVLWLSKMYFDRLVLYFGTLVANGWLIGMHNVNSTAVLHDRVNLSK